MPSHQVAQLQQSLNREMPISRAMEIKATSWDGERLTLEMPLAPNRNHQFSAFAGSLSALCTVTGWGRVFVMLGERGLQGNIVIRRSQIRYLRPVRDTTIRAVSLPVPGEESAYFFELLQGKGKSKVAVAVEIADAAGPLVTFNGSYVVQEVLKNV